MAAQFRQQVGQFVGIALRRQCDRREPYRQRNVVFDHYSSSMLGKK
jgi:hypothetical protein